MPLLDHFRPPLGEDWPRDGVHSAWAVAIASQLNRGVLLEGSLSAKALALVLEWANQNESELVADWDLARDQSPLNKIKPLE